MTSLKQSLEALGFDVKNWDLGCDMGGIVALQVTDLSGITFYTCEGRTLEQCLAQWEQKKLAFAEAEQTKDEV